MKQNNILNLSYGVDKKTGKISVRVDGDLSAIPGSAPLTTLLQAIPAPVAPEPTPVQKPIREADQVLLKRIELGEKLAAPTIALLRFYDDPAYQIRPELLKDYILNINKLIGVLVSVDVACSTIPNKALLTRFEICVYGDSTEDDNTSVIDQVGKLITLYQTYEFNRIIHTSEWVSYMPIPVGNYTDRALLAEFRDGIAAYLCGYRIEFKNRFINFHKSIWPLFNTVGKSNLLLNNVVRFDDYDPLAFVINQRGDLDVDKKEISLMEIYKKILEELV